MKTFKRSLLIYMILGVLISYAFGWVDLINNEWLTGNVITDLYKSVTYYFGWVLIYWWLYIVVGSVILAILTTASYTLYRRLSKK